MCIRDRFETYAVTLVATMLLGGLVMVDLGERAIMFPLVLGAISVSYTHLYAADDVLYLGEIAGRLTARLRELGREHWAAEDCAGLEDPRLYEPEPEQAYAVGQAAVQLALRGKNAVMPVIVRKSSKPYRWTIGEAPLAAVANKEKPVSYTHLDVYKRQCLNRGKRCCSRLRHGARLRLQARLNSLARLPRFHLEPRARALQARGYAALTGAARTAS